MEQAAAMNRIAIEASPVCGNHLHEAGHDRPQPTDDAAVDTFFLENVESHSAILQPGLGAGESKSAARMVIGTYPEMLINKLGERLAYKRSGIRVYEHLIAKCTHSAARPNAEIQLPIERLMKFHDQEAEHLVMLTRCLEHLGVNSGVRIPEADTAATGAMIVIMNSHTSLNQNLQAMLAIELADSVAWEFLINLAMDMGSVEMTRQFQHALMQKDTHLGDIREWYSQSNRAQTKIHLA